MIGAAHRRTRHLIPLILLMLALLGLVATASPAAAVTHTAEELEFFRLINTHRQTNGVARLLLSDVLSEAAEKHSQDMAKYNFFGHDTVESDWFPSGYKFWERLIAVGYSHYPMAENIAAGYAGAANTFAQWEGSSEHDANMLNPDLRVIGIGYAYNANSLYRHYWTTDFGGVVDPSAWDPEGGGGGTPVTRGWNLLAGGPGSDTLGVPLFGYANSSYSQVPAANLVAGRGYWAEFAAPTSVDLAAMPAPVTVPLLTGWNLIGNPCATPVALPAGVQVFVFEAGSYALRGTLEPHQGAWVNAASPRNLVLSPLP